MNKKLTYFIVTSLTLIQAVFAQEQLPVNKIREMAYADSARLVKIFIDIHQNPELGFTENRTAAIVAKDLKSMGYEVTTGIGKTGVIGILKNGNGPVIMYRADMDCNSVKETTGLSYASTKTAKNEEGIVVPVMHACGHDAHTTWLLGIAKIMMNLKNQWKGTLIFVAQPAEETGAGANAMSAEMYKNGVPEPDYLLGMHTAPVPVGHYLNAAGYRMAGADQLDVTFYGVGGHGSSPQEAKDPIVMAANAILQYQTIISRNMNPQSAAVLTVGAVQSGNDNNVIPAYAVLKLNLRWFNERDRNLMLEGIERINNGIALANNLPKDLYPKTNKKQYVIPLKNDSAMVIKINAALEQLGGSGKNIIGMPPVMGSEDFQHLVIPAKKQVYDYFLVGVANPNDFIQANKEGKQFPFFNHNGDFKVDLTAIPYYTFLGAGALLEMFQK